MTAVHSYREDEYLSKTYLTETKEKLRWPSGSHRSAPAGNSQIDVAAQQFPVIFQTKLCGTSFLLDNMLLPGYHCSLGELISTLTNAREP